MSKGKLPDYRLKQKILYIDKTSADALIRYGNLYLEENSPSDALEFYSKAEYAVGLQKVQDLAVKNGDTFLFQRAAKTRNVEPRQTEWEEIGRRAMELKKYAFARYAFEKAGKDELLGILTTTMKAEVEEKHP